MPLQEKKKKRITCQTLIICACFMGNQKNFWVKIVLRFLLGKHLCHSHEIPHFFPWSARHLRSKPRGGSLPSAPAPLEDKRFVLPSHILGWSCRFLRTHHSQRERCLLRTDSAKPGRQDLAHSKFSLEMVPTKCLSHGNRTLLATPSLGWLALMLPGGDRLKARPWRASSQQTERGYVAPQELLPG